MKDNTQRFVVEKDGTAVPLKGDGETQTGMYLPAEAAEIITIPATFGFRRKMRVALYPKDSPRPFPLTANQIQPGALKTGDLKNLKGKFLPDLIRRALELPNKLRVSEIIVFVLLGVSLLLGIVSAYMAYKVAHYLGLV